MNLIENMVKHAHPIHAKNCAYWDFLLQSYEGGIDYTNALVVNQPNQGNPFGDLFRIFINGKQQDTKNVHGNLFMHSKELVEDYNRRVQMSYYYNFCAPIIDIYGDHLFKQPIVADFGSIKDEVEAVSQDIDRKGSSIEEFRKQVSDTAQVYGHCFVVVDSPNIPETEVQTRLDQIEKRAFPYLTIYAPQMVKNWSLDCFGNTNWVLLMEVEDDNEEAEEFDPKKTAEVHYRLWTKTEWFKYDSDFKLEEQGVHGLGVVPIVCVYDKKSKKAPAYLGISSIADIAFISRDIYNACSELRQILRDQTFAFLALQGTTDEYASLSLGTGKGLLYPENRNAPQYVSPPSDNALTYFDHIDRQIAKIYQLAKLEGGGTQAKGVSASPDATSGVSKAWDFNQTNSSLSSKSANLEDAEYRIWSLFALWQGKEFDGSIQYPNDFSISSLMDDLDEAEKESRLDLGTTFNLEIRKAIIKKKFPRKPQEEVDKMAKEIETSLKKKTTSSIAERMGLTTTTTGGLKQGETK